MLPCLRLPTTLHCAPPCRLQGRQLAAVRFLPGSLDAAEATLDWEQRFDAGTGGGEGGSKGGGPSYSITATLPPGASWKDVGHVVTCFEDASGHRRLLSSTLVAAGGGGGGTVAFVFQGVQLAAPGSGRGRVLQQAAGASAPAAEPAALPPDCTLQVGDQALAFQGCQAVNMQPSTRYHVFHTIEPGASGAGARWRGGLAVDAASVGGAWAG